MAMPISLGLDNQARAAIYIICKKIGAGDANRTRDPNLGKVMLYP